NEAMRIGDRIAMMRDGRIEQIGTSDEILNNPANDYVARFIQDVDRSRVMTAEAILERPAETLGEDHGPRTAHRMLRESQNSWLIALNRDRTPRGVLWEDDVAEAVSRGQDQLPWVPGREMPVVSYDTPIAELFAPSAQHQNPLVVVDADGKFLGVIPRVTLLTAAVTGHSENGDVVTTVDSTNPRGADLLGHTTHVTHDGERGTPTAASCPASRSANGPRAASTG